MESNLLDEIDAKIYELGDEHISSPGVILTETNLINLEWLDIYGNTITISSKQKEWIDNMPNVLLGQTEIIFK